MDKDTNEVCRLDDVLQSIVDGVYTTDASKRITFWNKGAERITGFKAEDVIGRTCSEVLCHADEKGTSLCSNSCPISETMSIKSPIYGKDVYSGTAWGRPVPVSVSCSPIIDGEGNTLGAIEVFRDISEQKKLERQKADFYSMVTHDLKSPIQAITGYAELLLDLEDERLKEAAREFAAGILNNAARLNGMINDFLAVSKIESGMGARPVESSIAALLNKIHSNFTALASSRRITFAIEQEELPRLVFDPGLVERAVSNLVTNAFKFTPEGGTIKVSARAKCGRAEITVTDTGRGIKKEELGRVFGMYYRAEGSSGSEGAGLGLAIVKAIAEAHGGDVAAESEPGRGSAFTVSLPFPEHGKT